MTIFREDDILALADFYALFPGRIEIWRAGFCGGRRTRKPRETLGARRKPKINLTYIWHQAGIEPGPLWQETSTLLLP